MWRNEEDRNRTEQHSRSRRRRDKTREGFQIEVKEIKREEGAWKVIASTVES